MEYDNSTPFQILFYEGIFGNIIMIFISFFKLENAFSNKLPIEYLGILIIGFILYFFSCCFFNIYKLTVINFSSPTNVATCQNIALPLIIILSLFINKNEINNINNSLIYVLINFFSIILIILFCLLFNEIIIFSCQNENLFDNKIIIINNYLNNTLNNLSGTFTTEGEESF